ncbi:MAG: hypothetical protein ABW278_13965 [Steroidobacteraceae bacterium]
MSHLGTADLPEPLRSQVLGLFGPGAASVRIVEYSWVNALHAWPLAVTRRDRIYLRWGLAEFVAWPELVLHEYFHVVRQWNTGRLTMARYLRQHLCHGYRNNPFEIEARCFAADHCRAVQVQ